MNFFQTGTRTIKIIDFICFRLLPGFLFLYSVGKIWNQIDQSLRASESRFILPFTIVALFTFVNMLVWVLFGEEVYFQRTQTQGEEKITNGLIFFKHFFGLLMSFLFALYFRGEKTLFDSMIFSGAVYTVGTFLLEFGLVLPRCFFRSRGQDTQSHQNNILLGIFGIIFYIIPLLWVASLMEHPGYMSLNIVFIFLTRFKKPMVKK